MTTKPEPGQTAYEAWIAALSRRRVVKPFAWNDFGSEERERWAATEAACREGYVLASAPAPALPSVVVTDAMVDVLYDQLHSIGLAIGDDECSAALTAALAVGTVCVVPAGWQLVPQEASEAMWIAGQEADEHPGDSYSAIYDAMLAAAPPALTAEEGGR